jgi:hypothetical protein
VGGTFCQSLSKLSKGASYGDQMSGRWIKHWLDEIIKTNEGTDNDDLQRALKGDNAMLAFVSSIRVTNDVRNTPKIVWKYAAQKFDPPIGKKMIKSWGDI